MATVELSGNDFQKMAEKLQWVYKTQKTDDFEGKHAHQGLVSIYIVLQIQYRYLTVVLIDRIISLSVAV
jgi:hypothetical protein